mmetsp:Transcript_64182/g.150474  ORF Transcript_64182/g.150474 Transcript_64182/m.150474 type:complete len:311 (-) Transcript_64182:188-1120(-)
MLGHCMSGHEASQSVKPRRRMVTAISTVSMTVFATKEIWSAACSYASPRASPIMPVPSVMVPSAAPPTSLTVSTKSSTNLADTAVSREVWLPRACADDRCIMASWPLAALARGVEGFGEEGVALPENGVTNSRFCLWCRCFCTTFLKTDVATSTRCSCASWAKLGVGPGAVPACALRLWISLSCSSTFWRSLWISTCCSSATVSSCANFSVMNSKLTASSPKPCRGLFVPLTDVPLVVFVVVLFVPFPVMLLALISSLRFSNFGIALISFMLSTTLFLTSPSSVTLADALLAFVEFTVFASSRTARPATE